MSIFRVCPRVSSVCRVNIRGFASIGTDEEIAREAKMLPIAQVASERCHMSADQLELYGNYKAKVFPGDLAANPDGKLILVTAISPTKAGEGKTTTTVGLVDGLCKIGKNAMCALREPSLGPVFGMKGGAAGGGYAQVVPMDEINLHFTGDMHAIGAAHNLLSAMVDNHIKWKKEPLLDPLRTTWGRVVDVNDRALRDIFVGLGGVGNGVPRQDGFDITVASEVMACFCLANDFVDLQDRLSKIIVGFTSKREPVTAKDLNADGAMSALLAKAWNPNLVQTLENNPAFIHGGPFANIAHGCNTAIATKTALKMADYVVTEAGFGADLGAEKFFNIKCRKTGMSPDCVVLVATVRAVKMHGGQQFKDLVTEDVSAVKAGLDNMKRHISNCQKFGMPILVVINQFPTDTEAEVDALVRGCRDECGADIVLSNHFQHGGNGAQDFAERVVATIDAAEGNGHSLKLLYPDEMDLASKIETVATELYGASGIAISDSAAAKLRQFEKLGAGSFPICMAKTQYSFSADANKLGAPTGHVIPVGDVRLSAGAEFVVALTGSVMTMPGLPRKPAAEGITVGVNGDIHGLF